MRATLEFQLPEDELDHLLAVHGSEMQRVLMGVVNHLFKRLKHGELGEEARGELDLVRSLLLEGLSDLPGALRD